MSSSAPRFSTPLDSPRPRGARLLEGYSPKIGRRVRLFDRARFDQWLRLEADPTVLRLCERPMRIAAAPGSHVLDFWVERSDGERLLIVGDIDIDVEPFSPVAPGVPVQRIAAAELAAAAVWIANWQQMLPTIIATRSCLTAALTLSIQEYVREPMALSRIERACSIGDPSVVRGAIFELLRTGQLAAPSLHTQALSQHTLFGPAP